MLQWAADAILTATPERNFDMRFMRGQGEEKFMFGKYLSDKHIPWKRR